MAGLCLGRFDLLGFLLKAFPNWENMAAVLESYTLLSFALNRRRVNKTNFRILAHLWYGPHINIFTGFSKKTKENIRRIFFDFRSHRVI